MRRQFKPGIAATIITVLIGMGSFYDLSNNQLKQYRLQVAAKTLIDHLHLKPEYSFHQNVDLVRLFINKLDNRYFFRMMKGEYQLFKRQKLFDANY